MRDGTAIYDRTTDSLQAQRDHLDSVLDGAPTFAAAMDAHEYTSARAVKLDRLDMSLSELRASMPSLLLTTTLDETPTEPTNLVLVDGPPDDHALKGALVIITDSVNEKQKAVALVKDYNQLTKTLTLVADPGIFEIEEGDKVDVIATGAAVPLWLGGP